jgi:hypothetical protein
MEDGGLKIGGNGLRRSLGHVAPPRKPENHGTGVKTRQTADRHRPLKSVHQGMAAAKLPDR